MGQEKVNFQEMEFKDSKQAHWASIKKDEFSDDLESSSNDSDSMTSSFSSSSSSSSELADDASSSSSSTSPNSPLSYGPLYQLTELMVQLPIKRSLSKFYHGKSQTFASLANVKSVEDLAKKEMSYCRRMKPCKSYGGNLSNHHHKFGPKATITKRSPRRSISPSFAASHVTMVVNT